MKQENFLKVNLIMKKIIIFVLAVFVKTAFAGVCKNFTAASGAKTRNEEAHFKSKGFAPNYYKGLNEAETFNKAAEHLRKIKAGPELAHIPFFANQTEKTIAAFEKRLKKYNQENPEFLEERLKLLEKLKIEARKRIEDRSAAYSWWAFFNFRLIMMVSEPSAAVRMILGAKAYNPAERVKMGIETAYNKELAQGIKELEERPDILSLQNNFELDPEKISHEEVYTSQKLERIFLLFKSLSGISSPQLDILHILERIAPKEMWYDMDDLMTHEGAQEILSYIAEHTALGNLTPSFHYGEPIQDFIRTIEQFPQKIMFFTASELGIMAFNRLENNSHFIGLAASPMIVDGSERTPIDFFSHDLNHMFSTDSAEASQKILEIVGSISRPSKREKAELALFMYRHEGKASLFSPELREYYTGAKTNLSRSELRKTAKETKEAARAMMSPDLDRSILLMVPDDAAAPRRYLRSSANIFADILLAH